jgi:hypothetical protein
MATVRDLFNRSEVRQRVAEEDARPENQPYDGGWRDPMAPPAPEDCDGDGNYHPGPTFAEAFAALRPSQKSSGSHLVYDPHDSAGGAAASLAQQIHGRNRHQPAQAEEPAPPPPARNEAADRAEFARLWNEGEPARQARRGAKARAQDNE